MNIKRYLVPFLTALLLVVFATSCEDDGGASWDLEANYADADLKDGGQLYDKWWKVWAVTEPTGDHPRYPAAGGKSGADTWRCKECHGWDYVGKDGRYSSGSHFTGIDGLMAAADQDAEDVYDAIVDHVMGDDLDNLDMLDLTKFIKEGLVDMSLYITDGVATGDATAGATLYAANCASCHGADGNTLDFKSDAGDQGVGWLSNDNPQETLHKIRWGHPGSSMPSAISDGSLTDAQTGDILAYAQSLPHASYNWTGADIKNGGQLYDKWWAVIGATAPTTDNPLYPTTSAKSGSDTWRCKECHGWDYIGKDGRYASGSHYTGIDGLMAATAYTNTVIFDAIKDGGGTHDFSAVLADADIIDLSAFVANGLVDMSLYITDGVATGDTTAGATLFASNCASCHGTDGNTLDFESDDGVQGVGFLANDNPQETLHKIRWGHPGSTMPSAVDDTGLTDAQMGDILAHAQTL